MTFQAQSHLFPVFARSPLTFERGDGSWLFTDDGDAYLDFSSGIAVNALGHGHPRLLKALQDQAGKVWHVSNLYNITGQERLAELLSQISFADRVFFCNSGAEALELAIKAARRYHCCNGSPKRNRLITLDGAFHGRTRAALAATGQEKYLQGFEPRLDGFDQVPFGDLRALEEAITTHTAGILVEPIQGESGVRPLPPGHLRALRELCDRHGILLLLDEVQTGIARTGRFFAYEEAGITPDILATAKGLGGGFPIGACLATNAVASAMQPGSHGSTFGGNPLAMAVSNEVVDIVSKPDFLQRVRHASNRLIAQANNLVSSYPSVFGEVRGVGLLVGIQCVLPSADVMAELHSQKLLCVPAGNNVIRLLPALTVSDSDIDEAISRLARAAQQLERPASA
jgi:acetylornithine/N-succinyldiaminopimelate aminotransferase